MHAQDCTYGGVTVCSFALMCAVFTVIFFNIYIFCLCHKPWCDCSSHVCACVGTSYQHHECRCCQFCFIFLLQRSWVWFLLLLCAVVSFGAVKTDSWQDVFFFLDPEADKRTHSTCFMDSFWHCESHHWNKTSVDYLNTVGRGGEGREGREGGTVLIHDGGTL